MKARDSAALTAARLCCGVLLVVSSVHNFFIELEGGISGIWSWLLSGAWLLSLLAADVLLYRYGARPRGWYWRFCAAASAAGLICRLWDWDDSWFVFLSPAVPYFQFCPLLKRLFWPGRGRDCWCYGVAFLLSGIHLAYFSWLDSRGRTGGAE